MSKDTLKKVSENTNFQKGFIYKDFINMISLVNATMQWIATGKKKFCPDLMSTTPCQSHTCLTKLTFVWETKTRYELWHFELLDSVDQCMLIPIIQNDFIFGLLIFAFD